MQVQLVSHSEQASAPLKTIVGVKHFLEAEFQPRSAYSNSQSDDGLIVHFIYRQ